MDSIIVLCHTYHPALIHLKNGIHTSSWFDGSELAEVFMSQTGHIALRFDDGAVDEVGHWAAFFGDEVVNVEWEIPKRFRAAL